MEPKYCQSLRWTRSSYNDRVPGCTARFSMLDIIHWSPPAWCRLKDIEKVRGVLEGLQKMKMSKSGCGQHSQHRLPLSAQLVAPCYLPLCSGCRCFSATAMCHAMAKICPGANQCKHTHAHCSLHSLCHPSTAAPHPAILQARSKQKR